MSIVRCEAEIFANFVILHKFSLENQLYNPGYLLVLTKKANIYLLHMYERFLKNFFGSCFYSSNVL